MTNINDEAMAAVRLERSVKLIKTWLARGPMAEDAAIGFSDLLSLLDELQQERDADLLARLATGDAELADITAKHEALLYQYRACHDDKAERDAEVARLREDAVREIVTGFDAKIVEAEARLRGLPHWEVEEHLRHRITTWRTVVRELRSTPPPLPGIGETGS